MSKILLLFFLTGISSVSKAQPYALLIRGGYVIDPKTAVRDTLDIAVQKGCIVRMAKRIDPRQAARIVDARGAF
ncbi:MAG TPA: amidohydrolase/deacetylase family metallohydrolase, partial [Puia sp.]|nr:amidohydrolase/deacetylase family metallohydrolase [Puia sp.]